MTHDDLLPCGHPAACLRDGACGWCAAIRARERVLVHGVRGVSDDGLVPCVVGHAVLWHEGRDCPACALAAHVERLREALDVLGRSFDPGGGCLPDCGSMIEDASGRAGDCTCGYVDACEEDVPEFCRAALASTPAASLWAHDREVGARTLEAAAEIVADLEPTWNLGEAGAYVRAADALRARADAIRRGGS